MANNNVSLKRLKMREEMPSLEEMLTYLAQFKPHHISKKSSMEFQKNNFKRMIAEDVNKGIPADQAFEDAMDTIYDSYYIKKLMNTNQYLINFTKMIEKYYPDEKNEKRIYSERKFLQSLFEAQMCDDPNAIDELIQLVAITTPMLEQTLKEQKEKGEI